MAPQISPIKTGQNACRRQPEGQAPRDSVASSRVTVGRRLATPRADLKNDASRRTGLKPHQPKERRHSCRRPTKAKLHWGGNDRTGENHPYLALHRMDVGRWTFGRPNRYFFSAPGRIRIPLSPRVTVSI